MATATSAVRHRRDDLDGLRGVAIALVAVFHIWFGRVSGGVDVFLVLSGYFFGGMVLNRALSPGASLWFAGEPARRFAVIEAGVVQIRQMTPTGEGVVIGLFRDGEAIGLAAALEGGVFPADAIAIGGPVELLWIDADALRDAGAKEVRRHGGRGAMRSSSPPLGDRTALHRRRDGCRDSQPSITSRQSPAVVSVSLESRPSVAAERRPIAQSRRRPLSVARER